MSKIFEHVMRKQMEKEQKDQEALRLEAQKQAEEDLKKFVPIAKKILRIVVDADLDIGNVDITSSRPEKYAECARQIMEVMLEADIRFVDKEFPFQLAMQPLTFVQRIVMLDLTKSYNLAQAAAMGCDELDEVTFKTLDTVWKQYAEKKKQEKLEEESVRVEEVAPEVYTDDVEHSDDPAEPVPETPESTQ